MKANKTSIHGVIELIRAPASDNRGVFQRLYCGELLQPFLGGANIKQINHSFTATAGAIRGMHMQLNSAAEFKVISCVSGAVFDVALDLRRNSRTFLKWHGAILKPEKYNSMIIPPGVAHGFQTLHENCELLYFHTENYSPMDEFGVQFSDTKIGIEWPLPVTQVSQRDSSFKFLTDDFLGHDL